MIKLQKTDLRWTQYLLQVSKRIIILSQIFSVNQFIQFAKTIWMTFTKSELFSKFNSLTFAVNTSLKGKIIINRWL